MELGDYESKAHFYKKIMQLCDQAVEGLNDDDTLLAFPETIALPLLLSLGHFPAVRHSPSVKAALLAYLQKSWHRVIAAAWRQRHVALSSLYLAQAVPAYLAYKETFAEAARVFGVSIVAGSIFLPRVEEEASRGVHVAEPRVYNTAFSFAPTGTVLGRTPKVYLTAGAESQAGLSKGSLADLRLIHLPVGKVGVAICLDAFYSSVIEHFDGLGAEIIVQPSANHASWHRRWPPNPELSEEEAWLSYGLLKQVQNRQHIRIGINPMMVGKLWDLEASGRSSIVVNTGYYPHMQMSRAGLAAIAESAYEEAFVRLQL